MLNLVHERVSHDIVRNNFDDVESTVRTAIIDFDNALMGDIIQRIKLSVPMSLSLLQTCHSMMMLKERSSLYLILS